VFTEDADPERAAAVPAPVAAAPKPAPVRPPPLRRPSGPASQAWSSSAGAIAPALPPAAPKPSPSADAAAGPAIAPPPAAVDLAIPSVPDADSLAPSARTSRDSAALKRILKAVSGAKK
jgi:hypothetical protein